ncbi:sensor histidine kinase [Saccharothrix obliqua]|uniref:sensor histidine kinase n=1 Tax=Saccharothrix obliqua TaxID=2861747 RepID=UPI001C5DC714|nr:ATP-binding protein [Saccharothrix obliqua]MBW4720302.1 histidine kinase [Saccharothrix obliqua]
MRVVIVWVLGALPVVWAAITSRPGRITPWEAVAYLAVLAVALPLAGRRPVTALVVTAVAWQVGFFASARGDSTIAVGLLAGGLVGVAFLAGRHARTGERGVVALVLIGTSTATAALVLTGAVDTALAATSAVAVLAAVPWAVGRYRRQYTAMVRGGWERAEQLERDAEHVRVRERARLAAEMHDLVGHELAQAALLVGALEVAPALAPEHREAARAARSAVTSAAERLADVVSLLRTAEREPVESAADVVARARRSGLRVELTGDGPGDVDPVIAQTVHRVLTEAITNAIKHAPGAPVSVDLGRVEDGVELRVVSGPGRRTPDDVPGSGQGLLGLAERVALVGGRFTAGPDEGGGFAVTARLPGRAVATAVPHRHRVEQQVRRSARRAVLLTSAIAAGIVVAVLGYLVFDAATSTLDATAFQRLEPGRHESELDLPRRVRVDAPDDPLPVPGGATCRYYSTHINPFDGRRLDLHRLCFRDGVLVDKALLRRDP